MKNALRSLAIVITLIFTLNANALTVKADVKSQQKKDSLINVKREKSEMAIENFDSQIQENMDKTEENKGKITETEKEIKNAATDIIKTEKDAKKEQELFNSRMRNMYINGFDSYTSILLDSESFGDFVSRVDNIKTIIEYDKKVVDRFNDINDKINKKQQSLIKKKEVLLNLQIENKQKLNKIMVAKQAQNKLIAGNIVTGWTSNSQSVTESITKLNQIKKSVPNYTPSRGSAGVSSNAVIAYASGFLGTPYLWGGTTPSGFDCSGFTQYVYAHFGVSIGRSTFDQINDGVQVDKNSLQPGDLLFFGTLKNPHHVGIYVGNNTYIHAPHTGDVIKVSTLGRSDFVTARRVK